MCIRDRPYTTTGVFGKSSNVGTLMLAQRVGPERFYDMIRKFGLGQRANVGLPGESAGLVPPKMCIRDSCWWQRRSCSFCRYLMPRPCGHRRPASSR